ncbi:MAG: TRAP transporter small permease [Hyphomicrobium sp.]|nr:TRAP transporter small permease [Hyphomicrobium sp.]
MTKDPAAAPDERENVHLIVVEDEDVQIEHYVENWLAFLVFWGLGAIVFLQFFTRYVLNDSLAWTEEIARYALMWLTFIGAAVVARKNLHISVEVLLHYLPVVPARLLLAIVDAIKLLFIGLLAYFSLMIVERMQWQRMVIIDLPMSIVYGGVALGCFLMLIRQGIIFFRNARDGWRSAQKAIGEGMVVD